MCRGPSGHGLEFAQIRAIRPRAPSTIALRKPSSSPWMSMPLSIYRLLARKACLLTAPTMAALMMGLCSCLATAQTAPTAAADGAAVPEPPGANGPVRLRPAPSSAATSGPQYFAEDRERAPEPVIPYLPGEFERFAQAQAGGADVRRFDAELVSGGFDARAIEYSPLVPLDTDPAPARHRHCRHQECGSVRQRQV